MANEWNKTASVEFETMLRRHLKSGGAPVTACAGFDFDSASAYLEGALGDSQRAGYESHLAGCAVCRRHLIELSRLTQITPRLESQPAALADRTPAWSRWREAVAGWFDISSWNLKWQIAGAAGAAFAFAVLIAALGAQSWRQQPAQVDLAVRPSASPSPLILPEAETLQSPAPEATPQDAPPVVAINSNPADEAWPRKPVPVPNVELEVRDPDVAITANGDSMALDLIQPGETPVVARPGAARAKQSPPPGPRAFARRSYSRGTGESSLNAFREDSGDPLAASGPVQGARITPPPGFFNPMNTEPVSPGPPEPALSHRALAGSESREEQPKLESPGKSALDKSLSAVKMVIWPWPEIAKRSLAPFSKPDSGSEFERKARPDKQESADAESPRPLMKRIRDKVFRFEKNMWVDQSYKPEMQEWRVWTLTPGGEQYKQILANDPLLKEFFDHAPILVVWKNKIYKVPKRGKPGQ